MMRRDMLSRRHITAWKQEWIFSTSCLSSSLLYLTISFLNSHLQISLQVHLKPIDLIQEYERFWIHQKFIGIIHLSHQLDDKLDPYRSLIWIAYSTARELHHSARDNERSNLFSRMWRGCISIRAVLRHNIGRENVRDLSRLLLLRS